MTRTLILTALISLIVDQLSKWYVVFKMNLQTVGYIEFVPGFINFAFAKNYGINFGLFANDTETMRWILIAIAIGICIALLVWIRKDRRFLSQMCVGLIIGGALGNVLDRIVFGAVHDFLNVTCCGLNNPSAFNLADVAVFAGAIGLILFVRDDQNT